MSTYRQERALWNLRGRHLIMYPHQNPTKRHSYIDLCMHSIHIYWMSGFFGLLSFGLQVHTFFLSQLIICIELQPSTYDWEFLIGCVKIKNDLWSSRSSKMEHGSQQTQHLLFCMDGQSRNSFSLSALINTPWYCWWFLLWFLYALYKLQHENNTCRIPRHMLSR